MNSPSKSSFSGLVKYITDAQEDAQGLKKVSRLGDVRITNCYSEDVDLAVKEVLAVQQMNQRAKSDKTYHLLISFPEGERPSKETLIAIEDRLCSAMGYEEHQRISAIHGDTDNLHIHVAINKIHPEKLTLHEPHRDFHKQAKVREALEKEFGLERTNQASGKTVGQGRANDMERMSGTQSMISYIKENCIEALNQSNSWEAVHNVLQKNGLIIKQRGAGLVMGNGELFTKASNVDRSLSKGALEKRLGPYEAPNEGHSPKQRYRPLPLQSNAHFLWAKYCSLRENISELREEKIGPEKERHRALIEDAKSWYQVKRLWLNEIQDDDIRKLNQWLERRKMLREIKATNRAYIKARKEVIQQTARLTWNDWLKAEARKGSQEAVKILKKNQAKVATPRGDYFSGRTEPTKAIGRAPIDTVTRQGSVIYKAGDIGLYEVGKNALQVTKKRLSDASMKSALWVALQRFGQFFHVYGSRQFKNQAARVAGHFRLPVIFGDPALERVRRQQLRIGDLFNVRQRTADKLPSFHQSDLGGVRRPGEEPPPQRRDMLRSLSTLGVVRLDSGAKVLLPGDVRDGVEHQRAKRSHPLRRDVSGRGRGLNMPKPAALRANSVEQTVKTEKQKEGNAASIAAIAYIEERNNSRKTKDDVLLHKLYTSDDAGDFIYAGTRTKYDQTMLLLQRAFSLYVLPVDPKTAGRVRRNKLGTKVSVDQHGKVKTMTGKISR